MSFTAKDIENGVVDNPEKDFPACTCERCKGVRRGIDAQSSVPFRLNREKIRKILWERLKYSNSLTEEINNIADTICAKDKEIVEKDL